MRPESWSLEKNDIFSLKESSLDVRKFFKDKQLFSKALATVMCVILHVTQAGLNFSF